MTRRAKVKAIHRAQRLKSKGPKTDSRKGLYQDSVTKMKGSISALAAIGRAQKRADMNPQLIIRNFPMPPSANALYANNASIGRFGRSRSDKYRLFEQACKTWAVINAQFLNDACLFAKGIAKGQVFLVDHVYHFKAHKILCADGSPRKNDTSNRLKACDDVVAKLLGVDDSLFWNGTYTKFAITQDGFQESTDLRLTIISIPTKHPFPPNG